LKDHADAPTKALGRRFVFQRPVVDARTESLDRAVRGLGETGEDLEKGGLARAVGASTPGAYS
jgi:hypothetical protein